MSLLRNYQYLAVVLSHFVIDIFGNTGPVLVTFLSKPMALTAAQIGLAISMYQLVNAISQPLFGWLADKFGSRWIGPVSVAWVVGFMISAVFVAQVTNNFTFFLLVFVTGAVGSGAFHPQGTMHAATLAHARAATGTAVFFLFGQIGLASGPIVGGAILDVAGLFGIYGMAIVALPLILLIGYAAYRNVPVVSTHNVFPPAPSATTSIEPVKTIRWDAISLLALLIGLRSWVFLGTVAFLPKLFQDMGWEPSAYGSVTGVFWIASAVMGVVAGNWADRWGRRQVVFITLLIGSVPLYFLPLTNSWLAFPLAIISGGLIGASHSILVVIAQDLLPNSKSLASGITLGYLFGMGAVAAWSIGEMAVIWSLPTIIQAGAWIGMVAALFAFLLPSTRELTPSRPGGMAQNPTR